MSKKLAEGIDALVLDVKTGSGAFMKKEEDAAFLAKLMVDTGARMGKDVVALITDMDQPLGNLIGNSLEVVEVIDVLRGQGPKDLRDLCLELAGWMFYLGHVVKTVTEGRDKASQIIASGQGLETFRRMVELHGGDPRVIDNPALLPQTRGKFEVAALAKGYIGSIACESVGTACVMLGGGREKKEDSVDPAVGIVLHKKVGDAVDRGEPLCTVHYTADDRAARSKALLESSFVIADAPPATRRPLVHRVIQSSEAKH
jgi:pyrimidine-nucleoside phosphorylase